MINYYVHAGLASERRRDLMAEAQAARRAGQARSYRRRTGMSAARRPPLCWLASWLPSGWRAGPGFVPRGKRTVLRDGSEVLIRPVQGADAPLLAGGFARLSARSRQMRFLTVKKELSPAELRYFTEIDHHDHEALGAVDPGDGRGVGVPGMSGPRKTRRPPRLPSPSWMPGTAGDSAPNCWLSCRTVPAPKASAASPRWSRRTMRRWPAWRARWGQILPAASPPPWSMRSCWSQRRIRITPSAGQGNPAHRPPLDQALRIGVCGRRFSSATPNCRCSLTRFGGSQRRRLCRAGLRRGGHREVKPGRGGACPAARRGQDARRLLR